MSRHTPRVSTGLSRPLISAGRCLLAQRPDGPSSGGAVLRGTVYWERVVSPQVRAYMMCAAGKALCDASQLALPTSDSLARQGGDSDPHASCTPPPASLAVTCRRTRCAEQQPWALRVLGAPARFREHLRTIRSACLVNSSGNTHNTQSSEQLLTRARLSPAPVQSQGQYYL